MTKIPGNDRGGEAAQFPDRWIDEDGFERDKRGHLLPDPDEGSFAIETLERGDRGAALKFWQQIANGERNGEIDVFVRQVAMGLVNADALKGSQRRDEIVKAVGLSGQGHIDTVLPRRKRKNTKARDDRIAQLLSQSEKEIWRVLVEEGLVTQRPTGVASEKVPPVLRQAIQRAKRSEEERHRERSRGFENLEEGE